MQYSARCYILFRFLALVNLYVIIQVEVATIQYQQMN